MPASPLVPKNGAVAIGSLLMDYNTFEIETSQQVENITPYGNNINSVNAASGTPDIKINVGGFAMAHTAGTPLNMPTMGGSAGTSANGILTGIGTGATSTFTLDTGCSESGNVICSNYKVSHARIKGSVPVSLQLQNAGDFTEAWATS